MKLPAASLLSAAAAALLLATPARAAVSILHSFTAGANDGASPWGSLTLSYSKLYGMTRDGGISDNGTVFSMNTDGTGFSLLHRFAGGVDDGSGPYGSLTLSGSKLFGMTNSGGSNISGGTLFAMNTDGTGFSLLHTFSNIAIDGVHPYGSLTLSGSTLYGMAVEGTTGHSGSLFSIGTDGTGYHLVHRFTGSPNEGSNPLGSLTLSGSTLYGMTSGGGIASPGSSGLGTVFSVNTDGTGFSLLHMFTAGVSDGDYATGSLTLSGSTLYGMTVYGGSSNKGTLFSMNTDGTGYSLLYSFTGGASDGKNPYGSLTLSGSTLYGMTLFGGSNDTGTLFSIGVDGTGFGLLDSFGGAPADGAYPYYGDVTLSGDGSTVYGMTQSGGTANHGVVFARSLVPEPGAFALLGLGALLLHARRRRNVAA